MMVYCWWLRCSDAVMVEASLYRKGIVVFILCNLIKCLSKRILNGEDTKVTQQSSLYVQTFPYD